MIQTVFLDLDNTLLDFNRAEERAILGALSEAGIAARPDTAQRYSAINAEQWALIEQKKTTRQQALTRRFEILLSELGSDFPAEKMSEIYEAHLARGHFFIPDALFLLETLYPRYDLFLASNGTTRVQKGRLKSAGISRFFQGIFLSEEIGAAKPDPVFFDRCFFAIPNFCREKAIIVGDSLSSDIKGGRDAGIHTCWLNRDGKKSDGQIVPEYEISALLELPALLHRI